MVDVAAGTGKLTGLLAPRCGRVVAVEPLEGMWRELRAAVPSSLVAAGTAENLPLAGRSADAAVVAQAFHWFDGERAVAELRRVLRPGGGVAVLYNVRERAVEWTQRLADLLEPYRVDVPTAREGAWRAPFESLERRDYPFSHEIDAETMVSRVASISWVGVLPDDERQRLLDRVRALFDGMPDRFPIPNHTELWWCRPL